MNDNVFLLSGDSMCIILYQVSSKKDKNSPPLWDDHKLNSLRNGE